MKNNDRFSGRVLDAALEIQANYNADSIQSDEINRIEFTEDYHSDTNILLENGDLISGALTQNQIRLAPDAVSELTLARSSLKSIQFNAPKMILNKFGNTGRLEKDGEVMESLILRIYAPIHPTALPLTRTAVQRKLLW